MKLAALAQRAGKTAGKKLSGKRPCEEFERPHGAKIEKPVERRRRDASIVRGVCPAQEPVWIIERRHKGGSGECANANSAEPCQRASRSENEAGHGKEQQIEPEFRTDGPCAADHVAGGAGDVEPGLGECEARRRDPRRGEEFCSWNETHRKCGAGDIEWIEARETRQQKAHGGGRSFDGEAATVIVLQHEAAQREEKRHAEISEIGERRSVRAAEIDGMRGQHRIGGHAAQACQRRNLGPNHHAPPPGSPGGGAPGGTFIV